MPSQGTSLSRYGTLEDEKAAYRLWGWKWSPDQEPSGPPDPPDTYVKNLGPAQDVHGDFEADDVWQNLLMYRRTGNTHYRQMAANWAAYYNNYYESDLQSGGNPDSAYGYDHLFGYGLIDWYEESGDDASLATAIRLGEISLESYPTWKGRHPRMDARALLLATRLWERTGESRWRTQMDLVRNTVMDNASLNASYTQWDNTRGVYMTWDGVSGHSAAQADVLQVGWLNWALARYYEATGSTDSAVRDRLIAMARFAQRYAMNPADGQSGSAIAFDTGAPVYTPNLHAYTAQWADILVRGYRLTGDRALLDRAKLHWQNGTDAAAGRVGRFVNSVWLSGGQPFYRWNGDLTYTQLLFYDEVHSTGSTPSALPPMTVQKPAQGPPTSSSTPKMSQSPSPSTSPASTVQTAPASPSSSSTPRASAPAPPVSPSSAQTASPNPSAGLDLADNEWRLLTPKPSQRFVPKDMTATDVLSDQNMPVSREYGGIHYGDGKILYFGGGHGGYPGNDVEVYDISNNTWKQSYKPEVCNPADTTCNGVYGGWGVKTLTRQGRPYTEHTLAKIAWDPVNRRLVANLTAAFWSYDPISTQWTQLGPRRIGQDIYTWSLLPWDPDAGAWHVILTEQSGSDLPGVYKLVSGGWQRVAGLPKANYSEVYSTYLPDRHRHFVRVPRWPTQYWLFNASTLTWTPIISAPPGVNLDSFDYDTTHRVVIGVEHPALGTFRVWTYTPATDTWAQLTTLGPVPQQVAGFSGEAGLLRYDPINNVFIFLEAGGGSGGTGGRTRTWAYRYRR